MEGNMKKIKLSKFEQSIEDSAEEYVPASREMYKSIVEAIENHKKNSVLNMRVNSNDLNLIKSKAKKLGVKYQSFIAEILHKVAHS